MLKSKPLVFSPQKQLVFETVSADLARFNMHLATEANTEILFDLYEVETCDTAGLALLIEAKRLGAVKNRDVHFKNMSDTMLALATFCGVADLFSGV